MGSLRRARNLLVRTLHRLPRHGDAVSPEIDNDLFRTHLALYRFAGGLAAGRRALDLGCGTGYGAAELLAGGATEVVGVDLSPKAIAYARRRFGGSRAHFERRDAADLSDLGSFGLVVAINLLAHVEDAAGVIAAAAACLAPDGLLVASVPPILDAQTLDLHRGLPSHHSNLYLWDWEDRFRTRFSSLRLFRQLPPSGRGLDLAHPGPSTLSADDFRCEEIRLADLYDAGSLSAVWVAGRPGAR